MAKEAFILI